MSLAFRIGQALALHLDPPPVPTKPFDLEMRRRLRYAMALLDLQTSFDRLTTPIVPLSWTQTPYPANVNDASFNINLATPLSDTAELAFTDMTFPVLVCRAQTVCRQVDMTLALDPSDSAFDTIQARRGYVEDFRRWVLTLLRHSDPENNPLHWYAVQVAEWIIAQLHVAVERPLRKHPSYNPPRSGFSLLQVCTDILQRSQNLVRDPRGKSWSWFESIFTPWHSLSVAIAELCVCEDLATVEKYWDLVEKAYARSAELMAKSQSEMPWKPMEKLMKKARARRSSLLQRNSAQMDSSATLPGRPGPLSSLETSFQNQLRPVRNFYQGGEDEDVAQSSVLPALSFLRNLTAEEATPSTTSTAISPLPYTQPPVAPVYSGLQEALGNSNGIDSGSIDGSAEWANWESFLDDLYMPDNAWASSWS